MNIAELILWTSLFLIFHTYLGYIVILYFFVKFRGVRASTSRRNDSPSVSVVISIYNEGHTLPQKIQNLRLLHYSREKIEFILGSDGSTDATGSILQSIKDRQFRYRLFPERRGKAAVLNDLVSLASGDIVVFTDANTMFEANTIEMLVAPFDDPTTGAVCGNLVLRSDGGTVGGAGESAYWKYENAIKRLESEYKTSFGGTGAVYAARRLLYTALPTKTPVTDDLVVPLKILELGYFTKYEGKALAYEESENSVLGEFKRKARISAQNFSSLREFSNLLKPSRGFVAFGLWSHKIIRWVVPFLLMIAFVSTFILSFSSGLYRFILALEAAFMVLGAMGLFLDMAKARVGVLGIPYYLLATNAALLIGFVRFVLKLERPMWEVRRT